MKTNKFLLFATAIAASLAFTACSDDDDDNKGDDSADAVEYDIHAVDLGLPSGVKWSDQNLGANAPEEYGNYYAWGAIEPFDSYESDTYRAKVDVPNIPANFSGDVNFDAAAHDIGGKWRTPTYGEIHELNVNSTKEWTTVNGVNGLKVTGPNGNSIFIPAAGFYSANVLSKATFSGYLWSASIDPGYEGAGISGIINGGGFGGGGNYGYLGYSIRPVRD